MQFRDVRGFIAAAALCTTLAAACAPHITQSTPPPTSAAQPSVSDRLYFGRSIPGGGTVTDDAWDVFLRDVVTPRFPAGLTVWRARGQWRDRTGVIVHEETLVLELIHAPDAESEAAIRAIIDEYKRRFRQEAVLRLRDRVEVEY